MTVTVPAQLERAMRQMADERQVTVDQLVNEALQWYLRMDKELQDELAAWQDIRDEAAEVVEGNLQ